MANLAALSSPSPTFDDIHCHQIDCVPAPLADCKRNLDLPSSSPSKRPKLAKDGSEREFGALKLVNDLESAVDGDLHPSQLLQLQKRLLGLVSAVHEKIADMLD
jgi:hypothetical protein